MLSRHSGGTHQGNRLKCNFSRYTGPQLSQLAEPLWTDPWPKRVEMVQVHYKKKVKNVTLVN